MARIKNYRCKENDKKGYMDRLKIYKKIRKKDKNYLIHNLYYNIVKINGINQ